MMYRCSVIAAETEVVGKGLGWQPLVSAASVRILALDKPKRRLAGDFNFSVVRQDRRTKPNTRGAI